MRSFFVGTSVLLYAVGDEHPERQDSRSLLAAVTQGELRLHASVEAIQEFLHHRMRRSDRVKAVAQARLTTNLLVLHASDSAVLARAIDLVEGTKIRGRDAIHAATALLHGFGSIVTTDTDFNGIPGIERLAPAQALAMLSQ
ncbi:MAG: type II toxin-antitoxin system VapC family toxin [Nakamurella sp.]